ncbi:MAG: hypothetical protein A2506_06390 [Elusimicrobia bacterium RIFOXYD12_FULL_66_9]|nr:MAG: hypothetical protein A2506_06390 [Elusimicrobia bacterium RIFOXYD12_FULL_66_9]
MSTTTDVPTRFLKPLAPAQEYARKGARWAIVLAGGKGSRMQSFVKRWLGYVRPKQYCAFTGVHSMIEHTLERAAAIAGSWRVVTIISPEHRAFLQGPRAMRIPGSIIEQPESRDTGPGVFLPLARVMAQDPDAVVVLMPSDHFVFPHERFLALLEEAFLLAERLPDDLVLMAARPDSAETDYGWIIPGEAVAGSRAYRVGLFREKPNPADAARMRSQGGVWNTMIIVARASAIWELARKHQPDMVRSFDSIRNCIGLPNQSEAISAAYREMAALNFSSDILEHAAGRTVVLPMDGILWCDWGRPQRVVETLGQVGKPASFPIGLAADAPKTEEETIERRRDHMTTETAQQALYIDYPAVDETINSSHYTFRLSVPEEVSYVEISVDRGPWQPCRSACGFWWADWSNFQPGAHTLSARAVGLDGEPLNSLIRRFTVAGSTPLPAPKPPTPLRRHSHHVR